MKKSVEEEAFVIITPFGKKAAGVLMQKVFS